MDRTGNQDVTGDINKDGDGQRGENQTAPPQNFSTVHKVHLPSMFSLRASPRAKVYGKARVLITEKPSPVSSWIGIIGLEYYSDDPVCDGICLEMSIPSVH